MTELARSTKIRELADYLQRHTGGVSGTNSLATAIEGVSILRSDPLKQPMQCMIKPALCMTAQGSKFATFGRKRYDYSAGQALVVTVDMPSRGTAFAASDTEPYLGLICELDLAMLQSVADEIRLEQPAKAKNKASGAFVLDMSDQLLDGALRMVRLLDTPQAIKALYPGMMRELCFWLLSHPGGAQTLLLRSGHDRNLMQTIHLLRDRFRESLRIEDLAQAAHMSTTTFFRQFKAVTSMAPLQYQKQLRLLEARRLMMFGDANVETAAFDVGYASPSQFSREYSRAFGSSPRRDVSSLRAAQA
jgi:AraC-like DNA-binding protein